MSIRPARGYTALAEVDLDEPAGGFVSIVRPTGRGKSTILNAVASLPPPSSGDVTVDGTRLKGLYRRTGDMFQQDSLPPWKTVLADIEFGLELRGVDWDGRRDRARSPGSPPRAAAAHRVL